MFSTMLGDLAVFWLYVTLICYFLHYIKAMRSSCSWLHWLWFQLNKSMPIGYIYSCSSIFYNASDTLARVLQEFCKKLVVVFIADVCTSVTQNIILCHCSFMCGSIFSPRLSFLFSPYLLSPFFAPTILLLATFPYYFSPHPKSN